MPIWQYGGEPHAFAAHDHRKLAMRLELDEAEDDLRAGALQVARPADIGLLVEARFQFDKGRDGLARFRRFGERAHDRAVVGGAIERLLDGDHIGITRRLLQELDDDVEGFIRVMNGEVFLLDRQETVAAIIAHALGKARIVGLELEIGPVQRHEFGEIVEREHPVDLKRFIRRHVQFIGDERTQRLRHVGRDFEANDGAPAATFQRRLEEEHQILGLLLDFQIAVANDPEEPLPAQEIAGEKPLRVHGDERLERHEPLARAPCARQLNEAFDLGRQTHERLQCLSIPRPNQLQRQCEAKVGNEGKGMRRINRERRQHREDSVEEMVLEPLALRLRQLGRLENDNADFGDLAAQLAPAPQLLVCEPDDALADFHELLGGRQPIL